MNLTRFHEIVQGRINMYLGIAVKPLFGNRMVLLDYPVTSIPRWNYTNPHPELYEIINASRSRYIEHLKSFLGFTESLTKIPVQKSKTANQSQPYWVNGWIPGLDAVALYSFVAIKQPTYFIEVGSGNSTKFARRAIRDHGLTTKIISIDPNPRVEIDCLCDEVVREPVESCNLNIFNRLESGDILYVDNSHRALMNSDATAIFLDVLPRLKPGVIVHFHDIALPYDYPAEWIDRYYSEQYLLAAYLLARGHRFDILLPNWFVNLDDELKKILLPLWQRSEMQGVATQGGSFWIQMK
jgi:Methyltransferase domain